MEKAEQIYKVPEGWIWTTIGEIGIVQSGGTPSTRNQEFWGDEISWITPADLSGYNEKYISKGNRSLSKIGLDYSSAKLLPKGTVLFSSRAPIGYTVIAKKELATNQGFKNLIPTKSLNSEYVYYYFQTLKSQAEKVASGTTFLELSAIKFSLLPVPLAPLEEQQRIVSKIESLFSELDHAENGLLKAKQLLEIYKQALLKSAFEGKLTESWRKDNYQESAEKLLEQIKEERQKTYLKEIARWNEAVDKWEKDGKKGKKPQKPSNNSRVKPLNKNELSKLFPLPQTALWIKIGDVTLRTEYGSSAKSQNIGKIPVLRMGNIQNGKFDWSSLVFTSSTDEINQYLLKYNDVLFNRTNSSELVGKTAIYKGERPAIFAGYLIRINQIASLCNADFLNYYLNSQTAKNHGNSVKSDSVNQSNINAEKLKNYPFPYYSVLEQNSIVEILDNKFSIIERIQDTIEINLKKLKVLHQSILKSAFEGKLVESYPTDEAANNLLNRIKVEKEVYLEEQVEIKKIAPKKIKKMEKSLSIEEVLKSSDKPMLAQKVWQESKHNEDIAAFYAELKELGDKVIEIREGLDSFISLKK